MFASCVGLAALRGGVPIPEPTPIPLRPALAAPLALNMHAESVDGYEVYHVLLTSSGFELSVPALPSWRWTQDDRKTARATLRGVPEVNFSVEVYPAEALFPERPIGKPEMDGYLAWLRHEWLRDQTRFCQFHLLDSSADHPESLRVANSPEILDREGRVRGRFGRPSIDRLWGFPYQKIAYRCIEEVDSEEGEAEVVTTDHYEWWVGAPGYTGRAHFQTTNLAQSEELRLFVESQVREIVLMLSGADSTVSIR
jgi:hypothetical protein